MPLPTSDASPTLTKSERRSLGRYDTPRPLAQAVTDWAVRDKKDRVLEPSTGGGCIARSIASRLVELGAVASCVGAQIVAADIDPRALAETSRCCAPFCPQLVQGSFLQMGICHLGDSLFDVVVGNPPYVRLHTMDQAMRLQCRESLPPDVQLDAKASLWAYFPIHAFKFIKPGGRMAWILPETILHSIYGKQLLSWAAHQFGRCIAVSLRERCFMDDGAKERVVILLLDGAHQESLGEVEMIEFGTASECIAGLPQMAQRDSSVMPKLNGHAVPHLVSLDASEAAHVLETSPDMSRLGDFAEVRIGVVTGNNKFFVMNERQRREAALHRRHFQPVISKFADLGEGFDHQEEKSPPLEECTRNRWLLCPNPDSNDKSLAKFLALYSEEEIDANQTMKKRPHWQVTVLGELPDAYLQYMGKHAPRLVLNDSTSFCTNTIHRVLFKKEVSKSTMRAICLSMHSSYSQLSAEFEGRQYGSGVLKLEPSEAKRICFASAPKLLKSLSRRWESLNSLASAEGWSSVVEQIDHIIEANCPLLSSFLPAPKARELLRLVRKRRNSIHLSVG